MKIDYLVTSFDGGGAEFAIPSIVKLFTKMGHEVRVIACEAGDRLAEKRLQDAGFPTYSFSETRVSKIKHVLKYLKYIKQNQTPDIILTSLTRATIIGSIVGKLLKIPVASWKHSASLKLSTKLGKSLSKLWIADSYAVSKFVQTHMKVSSDNIITWPLFYCETEKVIPKTWTPEKTLRIGSIGRLHVVKNYPLFLKGISLFIRKYPQHAHQISVSILGDGTERSVLESLIVELGLKKHVTLLGYSPDIYKYLETLDLYAQPSVYEGMCLAAHEALSTGLPLLATPVGEMKVSLEHDTGFALKDDIPEAICTALKTIFDNPSILEKKSKNALDYMHDYYSKEIFEKRGCDVLKHMQALQISNAA